VLERVGDEVERDLQEAAAVCIHGDAIVDVVDGERDAVSLRRQFHDLLHVQQQVADAALAHLQSDAVALDRREVDHVVDEERHVPRRSRRLVEELRALLFRRSHAFAQQLERSGYGGQWRAQLMREVVIGALQLGGECVDAEKQGSVLATAQASADGAVGIQCLPVAAECAVAGAGLGITAV
jgi:hypothetical protein